MPPMDRPDHPDRTSDIDHRTSTKGLTTCSSAQKTDDLRPATGQYEAASLEARDISAWFGDHQVLDRVSLTMESREVTALIGPSGCGKSTFLRILNRMHELIAVGIAWPATSCWPTGGHLRRWPRS